MSTTKKTITIAAVESLGPNSTVWDTRVTGFGVRRQRGPGASYVLFFRTQAGQQRLATIGRHGSPWTPDTARDEALRLLAEVSKGNDPAAVKAAWRAAPTVAALCDAYLEAAESGKLLTRRKVAKKAASLAIEKGRIERHIKPLLGSKKVAVVTRQDIERFYNAVSDGKTATTVKTGKHGLARVTGGAGAARRTLGQLGAIFSFAVKQGLRADNPVHGVDRPADGKRERRLSPEEYARLGAALREAPKSLASAVAASRFVAVTGWRRAEVTGLTWASVDAATRTATLHNTKTGRSIRPLSRAALEILKGRSRDGELVFPSAADAKKPMAGYHKMWLRLAKMAALPADVTPHVLRHSFASEAFGLGLSELTIAFLLGHRKSSTTQGYIHADATLLRAADQVADHIAGLMGDAKATGAVVDLDARRA